MYRNSENTRPNLGNLDIRNPANHPQIIEQSMTKQQLLCMFERIKSQLDGHCSSQELIALKDLKKQLKNKYSISISNTIIDKFINVTNVGQMYNTVSNFGGIQKQIKSTVKEMSKKRYYLDKEAMRKRKKKYLSASKRVGRDICNNSMPFFKSHKNIDEAFVREKIFILKDFVNEEEFKRIQETLLKKVETIESTKYGNQAQKIRNYTVYEFILQKIFRLIQEDSSNIVIRQRYQKIYKKMKEEMVTIITNEDQVNEVIKTISVPSLRPTVNKQYKQQPKRHFFQLERDKQDLTSQIEETIESAKKSIKEALIKRGRPDFAYEIELSLENRATPCILSKKRI